ncbi:MAG: HAMP domain-containing histidine kinase [Bacteroidetes bacterium]|nr:HAMP domain-containing histidine kinase [Bacteroidota bacterium]
MVNVEQNLKRLKQLRVAILVTMFLSFGVFTTVLIYRSYLHQTKTLRSSKLEYLSAIVKTLALQIDANEHDQIVGAFLANNGHERLSEFKAYKQLFNKIEEKNNLHSSVYTLCKLKNSTSLHFVLNSGKDHFTGNPYNAPEFLLDNYELGGVFGPYTDDHGTWLSAFEPFFREDGSVAGIVQADIKLNKFQAEINDNILKKSINALWQFLVLMVVLIILTYYSGKYVRKAQNGLAELSLFLRKRNRELVDARTTIEAKNNELQLLNSTLEHKVGTRTQQLNAKNKELEALMYHASHRMKSPVVNIQGILQLDANAEAADLHDYLRYISRENNKQVRLLDYLSLSVNIEYLSSYQFVDLAELIRNVVQKIQPDEGIQFSLNDLLKKPLKTSSELLSIIVECVLENAFHFAKQADQPKVSVILRWHNEKFEIEITDNGQGMGNDILCRVFDMFYVGSNYSKGNGLGLYIAKKAVEKLNGEIEIKSKEEQGTTVLLSFNEIG